MAGAIVDARAANEPEEEFRRRATEAAKAALDAGHPLAAVAAAEAAGQRAARDRVRPQLLRGVERAAKRLREATAEHEHAIALAASAGLPVREVAARAGIAHATVTALVRRHGAGQTTALQGAESGTGKEPNDPGATAAAGTRA